MDYLLTMVLCSDGTALETTRLWPPTAKMILKYWPAPLVSILIPRESPRHSTAFAMSALYEETAGGSSAAFFPIWQQERTTKLRLRARMRSVQHLNKWLPLLVCRRSSPSKNSAKEDSLRPWRKNDIPQT